jgi:hypothetical protein
VSELPKERAGTPTKGAKAHVWTSVNDARASWSGAMRAHEQAPPDPGFRDRLRALAEAAAAMRDAHAQALDAGLAWRPVADSERARPPYELRPGTGRRGPPELWTRFDAGSAPAQPGRRQRQPGRRRRCLRRSGPGRLGVGRRATGRGRVARLAPPASVWPSASWSRSSSSLRTTSGRPPTPAARTGPASTREGSFACGKQ